MGFHSIVELLLRYGCDPKIKDDAKNDALFFANRRKHHKVIALLEEHVNGDYISWSPFRNNLFPIHIQNSIFTLLMIHKSDKSTFSSIPKRNLIRILNLSFFNKK